jgi:methyl-accepting chemotaxis protein
LTVSRRINLKKISGKKQFMNNMTIGKKIALGFGALILIAALLGGMAVFSMKSVQTQSQALAEGYVPESQIAGDLQDAFGTVVLNMRTYGLTAEQSYLDDARKALVDVHQLQQAAQKLSDAHPELVKLHENLKELDPVLAGYEKLIDQTEAKNKAILVGRDKLNQAAADFIANIDKLIVGQKAKQADEIKTNAEAPKLQQRADKLALANTIRGEGNAARIAVFKSQALRDPTLIGEGLATFEVIDKNFDELQAMLTQRVDIDELTQVKTDAHNYRDAMKAAMDDNVALVEIGKQRLEALNLVNALVNDIQNTGMKRTVEAADTSTQKLIAASWTMKFGLITALLIAVTIAFFIIRNSNQVLTAVANALDEGSDQVASAAAQVSSSSQSLAEGASEQAASLEETSSSLEEMASMTKRNAENAQKANDLAKQARTAADKGTADMQLMNGAMEAIKISSDDIAKIIKTIDEIAFQTNILALNAAVEAARAGEAGMGFAVVADEVRNLAQRSAQAAKETAGKIEGAITKTAQGVGISKQVAETLIEIATKARQVDELVSEVAGASREQTQGITQVNIAVGQMDKVTQSNAANAEESAAAAEELNSQAEVMKQSVGELLQLVGGKGQRHMASPIARSVHAREIRHAVPTVKRSVPARSNGHAPAASALSGKSNGRSEIPLDDDFKDF